MNKILRPKRPALIAMVSVMLVMSVWLIVRTDDSPDAANRRMMDNRLAALAKPMDTDDRAYLSMLGYKLLPRLAQKALVPEESRAYALLWARLPLPLQKRLATPWKLDPARKLAAHNVRMVFLDIVRDLDRAPSEAVEALPVLESLLERGCPPDLQYHVADQVRMITRQPARLLPYFARRLADQAVEVDARTVRQVLKLGKAATPLMPHLIRMLDSTNENSLTACHAAEVLAAIGPTVATAIPALRRATNSPDQILQLKARRALLAIQTETPPASINAGSVKTSQTTARPAD